MKWLKHHTDAHADAKLRKLTIRYGADGYALYWFCLELIAGKLYADKLTFELEHDAELIAHELKIDSARVQEIMRYMVSLGLFENENNKITCLKLAAHLDERYAWSHSLKIIIKVAKAGKLSSETLQQILSASEDALEIHDESIASLILASHTLPKGKGAKSRSARFSPPTPTEVDEYAASIGARVDGQRFVDFYESKGWKVGKNPMKSWRAAVRGWARSDRPHQKPAEEAYL